MRTGDRSGGWRWAAVWGWFKRLAGAPTPSASDEDLGVGERIVLGIIETADGWWIDMTSISDQANMSRSFTQRSLERLEGRGLIVTTRHDLLGTQVRLSAKGRDFLLEQRAKELPTPSGD